MSLAQIRTLGNEVLATPTDDDRQLIEQAKRDRNGFAAVYRQHCGMLLDHVYRRTGDMHATEDLVADAFLIAIRSLPRYRYRGVPLRFWLLRIATNVVNRWARRRRQRIRVETQAIPRADSPVSTTVGAIDNEHVQHALLSLAPKYQAVLALYHLEGLSVKETAAVIGCREGTVRSRLSRARDALREKLKIRR